MALEGEKITACMERNNDGIIETELPTEKVSVCPECYSYLIAEQSMASPDKPEEQAVIWVLYCTRCKEQVEPKFMELNERRFLNVGAMRKAKEVKV